MSVQINGTNGLTFNDGSSQQTAASGFGFKNRIINGNFGIWQRGTGPFTGGGTYGADRWFNGSGGASQTSSQSTDVPSASIAKYSVEVSNLSTATANNRIVQRIESANCFDLSGSAVTFSFWAKNVSGTAGLGIALLYATAVDNFSSTTLIDNPIIAADGDFSSDWKFYSYTFSALPSGVLNGLQLHITRTSTSTGAMRITGVQLEKGSTATSFDYRPYGTELVLCQRYYEVAGAGAAGRTNPAGGTSAVGLALPYKVTKRATPTIALISGITDQVAAAQTSTYTLSSIGGQNGTVNGAYMNGTPSSSTAAAAALCSYNDNWLSVSAEL